MIAGEKGKLFSFSMNLLLQTKYYIEKITECEKRGRGEITLKKRNKRIPDPKSLEN